MPVAVIGLKSIGATILNVDASNGGGSGAAQKVANANTPKGLLRFSQLNHLVAAQKAATQTTKKGLGILVSPTPSLSLGFGQLAQLVELRLQPACSTC